jgi:hypothetical protein
MALLLVLLVVSIFVVPVAFGEDGWGRLIVDGTLTLIIVSGALLLTQSRTTRLVVGACALVALAIRWAPWALPVAVTPLLREASMVVTFAVLAVLVGIKVFAPGSVTLNRVFAAVVLYLLLGLAWAMIYELLALRDPGAFSGAIRAGEGHVRWAYFSFVTFTTVGYGDVTPIAPAARSLAEHEALVGQLYPAVLLGRLVSLESQRTNPGS